MEQIISDKGKWGEAIHSLLAMVWRRVTLKNKLAALETELDIDWTTFENAGTMPVYVVQEGLGRKLLFMNVL